MDSRTFRSILANLNNDVVWIVTICPPKLFFHDSSGFILRFLNLFKLFGTVSITIGLTVTLRLHSFFQYSSQVRIFICLLVFQFSLSGSSGRQSPHYGRVFFLLIITRSGILAWIRWSVCNVKSQRILCVSFSRTDSGLGMYHLVIYSISISYTIPIEPSYPLNRV